jgi:DNA-binding NtrC family response regulator
VTGYQQGMTGRLFSDRPRRGPTAEVMASDPRDRNALAKLVGDSPELRRIIEQIPAIAESDATVLITGETGTGKELVARALHYLSKRASCPFVPVNCGSFSEMLFEDELFGHERGAYTGAHDRRAGLVAHAVGGTLFLDEVDTLPPKAQVSLLRLLQEKTYRLVGSSVEQKGDVRIVAATNAHLNQPSQSGIFRADLYYRLHVFSINLPPLRNRREDILALASHLLRKHTPAGKCPLTLASNAIEGLFSYDWPGNVRELENAIVRGIHLASTELIDVDDLGLPSPGDGGRTTAVVGVQVQTFREAKRDVLDRFETEYLTRLLALHRGNVSQAARTAGKDRRDFGKLLKKHCIDPKCFRGSESRPADRGENPAGAAEFSTQQDSSLSAKDQRTGQTI